MSHPYCGHDPSLSDKTVRELPRELSGGVASFEFYKINSLAEQAGHGGSSLFGLLISCLYVQMDFVFAFVFFLFLHLPRRSHMTTGNAGGMTELPHREHRACQEAVTLFQQRGREISEQFGALTSS